MHRVGTLLKGRCTQMVAHPLVQVALIRDKYVNCILILEGGAEVVVAEEDSQLPRLESLSRIHQTFLVSMTFQCKMNERSKFSHIIMPNDQWLQIPRCPRKIPGAG